MTAFSIDLDQWLRQPNEWGSDAAAKKEAKEEDDWAKAFSGVKGDNPFELLVGVLGALGAVLNGDVHQQEGEDVKTPACGMESEAKQDDEATHRVETPEAMQERKIPTPTPLPLPMRQPFPAPSSNFDDESASPSRKLLSKMLGQSTLSFSMVDLPIEADSPDPTPVPSATLKRRSVSFAELPVIHHVESFKGFPGLWDDAYMVPTPPQT